ncbi:MAG: YfhO family protein [Oscillospiraceae bacterium]|nr:YfhO family protein [Oscillospiraceae bacterium]
MEKNKFGLKEYFGSDTLEKKAGVFLTAFLMSLLTFLLFAAANGGVYTYYGDYNLQQIPFYYHVHEAVREGIFGWDHVTDLGSDLVGSYSFYLLGSPFFWITLPFPNAALPHLMPWLLALKTGLAALFAYIYIRGFTKSTKAAFLGGILYAFSGFQIYNLIFNHFHDATAFFPLLLYSSDRLFIKGRKGLFAAVVALCACTNYFLFAHMVLFTVIYFVINCICGRYGLTARKFLVYGCEAVLGVLCAAVILLPSANAVIGNGRAAEHFAGNPLIYDEWQKYFVLFKSFFTSSDIALHMYLDTSVELSESSTAAYLPFVSMCGVIGYFFVRDKKKDMLSVTFIVSLVFLFVPVLNSAFSMFNAQFYTRWLFAPILIMCTMTSVCADTDVRAFKRGMIPSVAAAFAVMSFYIVYTMLKDGSGFDMSSVSFELCQCILPIGCIMMMYSLFNDKNVVTESAIVSGIIIRSCVTSFLILLLTEGNVHLIEHNERIYNEAFLGSPEQAQSIRGTDLFRVDQCENLMNLNLMWNMGSAKSFISIVDPSVQEIMTKAGFERGTSSSIPTNFLAYRCLLSVKYYLDYPYLNDDGTYKEPFEHPVGLDIFDYKTTLSNVLVYENECFIPMGFTYDKYITESGFDSIESRYDRLQSLLCGVVLTDEQISRFSDILTPYDTSLAGYDEAELRRICTEKASNCCEYFRTDEKGVDALFTGDKEELLFVSIPYNKGWSCTVNGVETDIEKVSFGFMAIRTVPGENIIRFEYKNPYVTAGGIISVVSAAVLAVYIYMANRKTVKNNQ